MGNWSRRIFNAAELLDISIRYEAGESINALRIEYGCNPESIQGALREAGVTPRTQREAMQTAAMREKSRESLLRRLPSMRGPATDTPIERRLCDALMAVGIGFATQSLLLGRYLVDIEIHQAPVILEADGAQHTLRKQKAKDEARDRALVAAGYQVLRFTGSEINRDASRCVQYAIGQCGLTPDRNPVYEIRTRFAGPRHPNWKGGDAEFTCANCGTVFKKQPKHRTGEYAYCNQRCYGEWLSAHPEANNARLRRDWSQLRELYEAGMSSKQLADYYECSQKGVLSALRNQGIPVRSQGGHRVKGGFYAAGTKPNQ